MGRMMTVEEMCIVRRDESLVSHAYLRRRVAAYLSKWSRRFYSVEARATVMSATIDNVEWLRCRRGYVVDAVCRAVDEELWGRPFDRDPVRDLRSESR